MRYFKHLLILSLWLAVGPVQAMGERLEPESVSVKRSAGTMANGAFEPVRDNQKRQRTVGWKVPSVAEGASASNVLVRRTTTYLYASDFGLRIPEDAEITGLEVRVRRWRSLFGAVTDESVRIVVDGRPAGEDKAKTGTQWTDEPQEVTYGGADDRWGLRIEPEQINRADFGIALKAAMIPLDNPQTAHVSGVELIVHYNTIR